MPKPATCAHLPPSFTHPIQRRGKNIARRQIWFNRYLSHFEAALAASLLRAAGNKQLPLEKLAAVAKNVSHEAAASQAMAVMYAGNAITGAVNVTVDGVAAADGTLGAYVVATNSGLPVSSREALEMVRANIENDLDQLQAGRGANSLLADPLWSHADSNSSLVMLAWDEWREMSQSSVAADTFSNLLLRIHHGEPNLRHLQQIVDNWHSKYPADSLTDLNLREWVEVPDQQSEDAESASGTSLLIRPSGGRVRRIVQPHLVSNTNVTTDAEAERLTPNADRCMRALREFLVSEETRPPLTVAVEAPWGGGKSSLMRHLQEALMNASDPKFKRRPFKEEPISTVWFNPWKHEAGKTLWAAFAIAFERQMAENFNWRRRFWLRIRLAFGRLSASEWMILIARLLVWLGIAGVLIWLCSHPDLLAGDDSKDGVVAILQRSAPWIGLPLLLWQLISTWNKEFGSPLKLDVNRLLSHSDHADKVDDLHRFHEDFRRLLHAYIPKRKGGQRGKAVVFIDDLDRCEAPKAAELLQSLHQMLNVQERCRDKDDAHAPGVICVLGMDREKVAAAVAAKHEKLLPMLIKTGDATSKISREQAMSFGHEFLEKFIQLTLHLPPLQGRDLEEYLVSITGAKAAVEELPADSGSAGPPLSFDFPPGSPPPENIERGSPGPEDYKGQETQDSDEQQATVERIERVSEDLDDGHVVLECARYVAPALENNPRKLKQFVNLFRLRLYLAAAMNVLNLPGREDNTKADDANLSVPLGKLSVHHIAKLVALELASPSGMGHIRELPVSEMASAMEKEFVKDRCPVLHALIGLKGKSDAFNLRHASLEAYFHHFQAEVSQGPGS